MSVGLLGLGLVTVFRRKGTAGAPAMAVRCLLQAGPPSWLELREPCAGRWVQEFLNEENRGLDVLLEYLAFAQCSVT